MADESRSGTNFASSSVIVAAVVATGAYFFHRDAPLVDMRPAAESRAEEYIAPQTVEARLWQDPLAAIDKSRDKSSQLNTEKKCRNNPGVDDACKAPLGEKDQDTLVLAVTVPGAPYAEDAERRRRTRYAVVAGLKQSGFVPQDARHLDYFVWTQFEQTRFPALLALPSPALPRMSSGTLPVSWGMPPVPNHASTPLAAKPPPFGVDPIQSAQSQADVESITVPYERFEKIPQPDQDAGKGERKSILVLWLREDALTGKPLAKFSSLINFLHQDTYSGNDIKIVGPFSSNVLHDMIREASDDPEINKRKWPELRSVGFYSYGASTADDLLFDTSRNGCHINVQKYLEQHGIQLRRMIATDDALADGIASELSRRRVYPDFEHKDHIALISEWDTFYGQTLPKSVERKLAPDGALQHPWIHKFTYLRGLDGLLPAGGGKEDTKQDKTTASGEKRGGTTDYFKIESDTQSLERPIGQSQYDYLRRISEHLHKIDNDLRKHGHDEKLKAVGILGGDVFDKLLILRALRLEFPEAVFFTTDYDEDFRTKSELPYTRNLIISSSFGPNLSDWLQGEIPFFRDTYETSAFLATQLAIGNLAKTSDTPNNFSSDISSQLLAPRLFEIKRSGEVLPFAWRMPAASSPQLPDQKPAVADNDRPMEGRSVSPCWKDGDISSCGYIQPIDSAKLAHPDDPIIIEKPFPTYEEGTRKTLVKGLALGALLVFGVLLGFRSVRKHAFVETLLFALGLGVTAVTCAYWETIAQYLTENGDGEPIAILEGVSVWPTVVLRGLGVILSLYFIWRVMRSLHNNLEEIAEDMDLRPKPVSLWRQIMGIREDATSLWRTAASLFRFSRENSPLDQTLALNVEAAWQRYVTHERFWQRCVRAGLFSAVMFGIFIFVLKPMFGTPLIPARGHRALDAYHLTTIIEVLMTQFLTFFIFDATLSCLLFVNKLRLAQSQWPLTTFGIYKGRLRLQTKLVHDWIDLEFVVKRTDCIGSLIYFPFILIALLIVSRSTIFANYSPSLTILIAQGLSLSVVFSCAIMLCWAARATRELAKQHLNDGIIRAKDSDSDVRFAGQLEGLLNRVDQLKDGAFSPLAQQPLVRAVILPLGSFGWTALIENGMLPGL